MKACRRRLELGNRRSEFVSRPKLVHVEAVQIFLEIYDLAKDEQVFPVFFPYNLLVSFFEESSQHRWRTQRRIQRTHGWQLQELLKREYPDRSNRFHVRVYFFLVFLFLCFLMLYSKDRECWYPLESIFFYIFTTSLQQMHIC